MLSLNIYIQGVSERTLPQRIFSKVLLAKGPSKLLGFPDCQSKIANHKLGITNRTYTCSDKIMKFLKKRGQSLHFKSPL